MPRAVALTFLTALVFLAVAALAAPGDTLYVQGNGVNVRTAPSLKATVKRQVHYGHVVIELQRQGAWVHVSVSHTGGKTGWIHASLLHTVPHDRPTETP